MKAELVSRWYKLIAICFIAIVVFIAHKTLIYAKDVTGVTDSTIKIGAIFDQTGPAAVVAVPATQGLRSYFRHINDQGGINGRKIKLLVEDDRYSIPMAMSAFKKLVFKDHAFILMGPSSSSALTALSKSIQTQKIPNISLVSPEIAVKPFKRYIFTIQDIYPGQMKVIVDYIMKDLKAKNPRIAFVVPDSEAGKADLVPGLERLKSYNLEPVAKEVLNPGSIEATSQGMNLKKAKVDYIIICGSIPQPTILLLRELKKFGLKVPLICSWASGTEEVIHIAGDASKLFYAVSGAASWYDEGPGGQG